MIVSHNHHQNGEGSPVRPPMDVVEMKGLIAARQVELSAKPQRVLEYAFVNPYEAAFATSRELARSCGVSVSTIRRVAIAFGFEDFSQFRYVFRTEVRRTAVRL